jgi:hypothetical protein
MSGSEIPPFFIVGQTMNLPTPCLRFAPSRVEGLADVSEVAVFPDRLELKAGGQVGSVPVRRDSARAVIGCPDTTRRTSPIN